jgi:hypothetical protein
MPNIVSRKLIQSKPLMSFQQASHVIPTEARAGAWNLWEAVKESRPYITASKSIDSKLSHIST